VKQAYAQSIVGRHALPKLPGLHTVRYSRLLTQSELSELSGVSLRTIVDLELGKRGAHIKTLRCLCRALNATSAELLSEPQQRAG